MTRDEKHSKKFDKLLKGRKVEFARYMTREEADNFGWYKRPLAIFFNDGTTLVLQMDDEGNDGGAGLIINDEVEETIYTIS